MFDLSKSLRDWKHQLGQGGGCSQDNINELEEHLREEMEGLTKAGLSSEEAFLLATRRLGKVDALNEEFGKVNTRLVWLNRLRWMASGVLIYMGALTAEAALRKTLAAGAVMAGLDPFVAGILVALASFGVMALAVIFAMKIISHRRIDDEGTYPRALATKCNLLFCAMLWFTLLPLGGILFWRNFSPAVLGRVFSAWWCIDSPLSVLLPMAIASWLLMGTNKGIRTST